MAKTPTITYLPGYSVRPASVNGFGVVKFTDGINEVTPNQLQCEAYGHTYNRSTGTCTAFIYSSTLNSILTGESNNIQGSENVIGIGTNNTYSWN